MVWALNPRLISCKSTNYLQDHARIKVIIKQNYVPMFLINSQQLLSNCFGIKLCLFVIVIKITYLLPIYLNKYIHTYMITFQTTLNTRLPLANAVCYKKNQFQGRFSKKPTCKIAKNKIFLKKIYWNRVSARLCDMCLSLYLWATLDFSHFHYLFFWLMGLLYMHHYLEMFDLLHTHTNMYIFE